MTLGIGRRANVMRCLNGFGTPMMLPQHDVILLAGRPMAAGAHAANPMQVDISRNAKKSTVSSATNVRPYRAANSSTITGIGLSDDAWLHYVSSTTADYAELDYDSQNAITAGDFHVRGRLFVGQTGGFVSTNTYYLFGIQGTTPNGADTAWQVFVGLSSQQALGFIVSNGTTRSVYGSSTGDVIAQGWYDLVVERYNGTLYGYVNGTRKFTQAYSSTLNIPSATKMRFGRTSGGFGNVHGPLMFDFVQVKRRSLFLGAATCPSPTYPFPN